MNRGWTLDELKHTFGESPSPLPTSINEPDTAILQEVEKDEETCKKRSKEEGSVCIDAGYTADVNAHEVNEAIVMNATEVEEVTKPYACNTYEYDDFR